MSLQDHLARCDEEIARCREQIFAGATGSELEGLLMGLGDWTVERRFILREIEDRLAMRRGHGR